LLTLYALTIATDISRDVYHYLTSVKAGPIGRAVEDVGLRPLVCWDCGFEFVCCDFYVISGRGLCEELIPRPGKSYRLWCIVVCDL